MPPRAICSVTLGLSAKQAALGELFCTPPTLKCQDTGPCEHLNSSGSSLPCTLRSSP